MNKILIDEKACVGCTLCVETCTTKVFKFDEGKRLPIVDQPAECFECLSCSEICPADAIEHQGITLSSNFYHDPHSLQLAARIAGEGWTSPHVLTGEKEMNNALADLGVRLLSVAAVFKQTLGSSLPAVGTLAGRTLAGHMPRFRKPENRDKALALARNLFAPAWDLGFASPEESKLLIEVKDCYVRTLCANEKQELGGELCILFYNYLAGYLSKVLKARPKLTKADRSRSGCRYEVTLF